MQQLLKLDFNERDQSDFNNRVGKSRLPYKRKFDGGNTESNVYVVSYLIRLYLEENKITTHRLNAITLQVR